MTAEKVGITEPVIERSLGIHAVLSGQNEGAEGKLTRLGPATGGEGGTGTGTGETV